jgi:hypothetical protein
MKGKRGMKFLDMLNSKPVIGALIFLILGLSMVFAGDVIVKEGAVEIGDDLNASGVLFVNGTSGNVGIGTASPSFTLGNKGIHILDANSPAIRLQDTDNINSDYMIFSPDGSNDLRFYHVNTTTTLFRTTSAGLFYVIGQIYADPDLNVGSDTACWSGTGVNSELGECSSSEVYKDSIQDLEPGLSLVNQMRPVSFDWTTTGKSDVGFISEEVLLIEPRLVRVDSDTGEIGGVNYRHYTAILTKAIQELDDKVILLEQENQLLKDSLCEIKPELELCN